jgi:hypothetical protein
LCVVLFAGCTASFTYDHLDWLIPWFVDGYVDLTREQRNALEGQLEPLLRWHRDEELIRYVAIVDQIEREVAAPVTAEIVQGWIDETLTAAERTELSMLALALDFGATVSDAQMAEFTANLWKRQREYEEEFLARSDEQYRQDSFDHLTDVLGRFVGRLDREQKQRLRAATTMLHRFDGAWLEERAVWLRELEPLLQREPGWQQAVQQAYSARKVRRTPRYKDFLAHNLDVINHAVADVLNRLSSRQRKHLADEMDDLRSRLRKLMDKPQPARIPTAAASSVRGLAQHVVVKTDGLEVDLDRNMLVDAMDEFEGPLIRRYRQKPVDVGGQRVEVLCVGAAPYHIGGNQGRCIHCADGAGYNFVAA